MLAIRLPEPMEARLDKLAKKTGRTKSYYVREALAEYLADLEDIYLADKAYLEYKKGKRKGIPLDKVMKRYGLGR